MLVLPDFTQPFELACNASIVATGAEMSQGGYPVVFHSKKLSPAETRYHVGDRKLLGQIPGLHEVEVLPSWKKM